MKKRVSLDELRTAISRQRIVSFTYQNRRVRVEPRMLGQAPRTEAYVLLAWALDEDPGWEIYRYAEIRDWKVHEEMIDPTREGAGALKRQLAVLDTWAVPVRW